MTRQLTRAEAVTTMEDTVIIAFDHNERIDERLFLDIWDINGPFNIYGKAIPRATLEAEAASKVRRMDKVGFSFGITLPPREGDSQRQGLSVGFTRMSGMEVGGDGELQEGAIVEFGILARSEKVMATITADPPAKGDSRLIETALAVARRQRASFAFGDNALEFCDPNPSNPRSRAWGLAYYGLDLVRDLGRDRLASAPAYKVDFDDRGGCWLWLDASPFAPSSEKEARRAAVEAHLGLRERFPDVP